MTRLPVPGAMYNSPESSCERGKMDPQHVHEMLPQTLAAWHNSGIHVKRNPINRELKCTASGT